MNIMKIINKNMKNEIINSILKHASDTWIRDILYFINWEKGMMGKEEKKPNAIQMKNELIENIIASDDFVLIQSIWELIKDEEIEAIQNYIEEKEKRGV